VVPPDQVYLPNGAYHAEGTTTGSMSGVVEVYDPELAEYNAYLAKLNRKAENSGR